MVVAPHPPRRAGHCDRLCSRGSHPELNGDAIQRRPKIRAFEWQKRDLKSACPHRFNDHRRVFIRVDKCDNRTTDERAAEPLQLQ